MTIIQQGIENNMKTTSLVRYQNKSPLTFFKDTLETRMNSLFQDFENDIFTDDFFDLPFGISNKSKTDYPRVKEIESQDSYTIEATIPGLTKEDIKIEIQESNNQKHLTISGNKRTIIKDERNKILRNEIHESNFCRAWSLPGDIDDSKISASSDNGILKITLPKRDDIKKIEQKPNIKNIEIK